MRFALWTVSLILVGTTAVAAPPAPTAPAVALPLREVEIHFTALRTDRGTGMAEWFSFYDLDKATLTEKKPAKGELNGINVSAESPVAAKYVLTAWFLEDGPLALQGTIDLPDGDSTVTVNILGRIPTEGDTRIVGRVTKPNGVSYKIQASYSVLTKPATPFSLKDMSGATVTLADLKGKWVYLDFWATWCGPCKVSLPHTQELAKRQDLVVLAVNVWERKPHDELLTLVKDFLTTNKYDFHVVLDETGDIATAYKVQGIPTFVLIDPNGWVRRVWVGSGQNEDITKVIDELVGGKSSTQ